ncbi:MAG: MFS transporter [Acidimicrobiales bacterium]
MHEAPSDPPAPAAAPARRGARPLSWAMWGLAASVYLAAVFHRNGLAVASLTAEHRFHVGPSVLAVFVALQLGIYAAMQIPNGAMADRYGPRRMLTLAAALMAVGELLFAITHVAALALLGRALVGFGDAITFLNVLRLVQNWFPVSRYGLLAALTAFVGGVGQLVSTVPLHTGLTHFGWTPTFTTTAVLTAVIAVPVWLWLRDRPGEPRGVVSPARRDLPAGIGLGAAVREVVARPGTLRGMWAHFTLTGPFAVFTALWGFPFLVRADHLHAAAASSALGLVVLAAVAGSPVVGWLMLHAPGWRVPLVYVVSGLLLVSWVALLAVGPGHDPGWLTASALVMTGLGGPTTAVAFDLAREANRPERGGAATGVVNIGGFTGAVLADLVIGGLLSVLGHGERAYAVSFAVIPVMVAFGLGAFWWYGRPARALLAVGQPPGDG